MWCVTVSLALSFKALLGETSEAPGHMWRPQSARRSGDAGRLHWRHCCCSRHWICLQQRGVSWCFPPVQSRFATAVMTSVVFRSELTALQRLIVCLSSSPSRLINVFDFEGDFADRSVGTQGGFQAAGTCVAVAFGLVGGAIVGEFY